MSKYIAAAIAALALALSPASAGNLQVAADATYKLYEDGRGICSATFIKNVDEGALMLTAAHCADGSKATEYTIRLESHGMSVGPKEERSLEVTSAEVIYLRTLRVLKDHDVALFVTKDKTAGVKLGTPVDLATVDEANSVKFGDDLVVLGFPAAEEKTITKGQFTGKINGKLDVQFHYQTNIPVAGGNSGGGLYANFKDKDGNDNWKQFGVTSAARRDNSIMTYFAVAEAIKEVTAGYMNDKRQPTPETPKTGSMDEK